MKIWANFYRIDGDVGHCNPSGISSESYDTEEKARAVYEDAADHPWIKYQAVAVPVEFEVSGALRK